MRTNIKWAELDLPDYEDMQETRVRLDAIHRALLQQKGIEAKPEHNSPGFDPTPAQAREVAVMAALGLEAKDIALVLNIELSILKLYYSKELRISHNLANAMVAQRALKMALDGRFPDMTKFWLKARAGWSEKASEATAEATQGGDGSSAKDRLKRALNASKPALPNG